MRHQFYINKIGKLVEVQKIYNRPSFIDGYFEPSYVYTPYIPLQVTKTIFARTDE